MKIKKRLLWFIFVGIAAAITHLLVVSISVDILGPPPLVSNIFAFIIAFNISFWGHKRTTFSNLSDNKELKPLPFLGVSLLSFVVNEVLYYFFLTYTSLNYLLSLFIVLVTVSMLTFLSAQLWACR